MGEGPVVAIIRGLKVHIRVLDRFLYNNGCHDTKGYPPFYEEDPDEFSTLLRSRLSGNNSRTRLFIPARTDNDQSKFGYVAWAYNMVYAQKEVRLEEDLPMDPPEGWDALKDEILSFSTSEDTTLEAFGHGKTGIFVIVCEERSYTPLSIHQRPSHCDQCEAVLDSFIDRQSHRIMEHGSDEGFDPLPDDE
ncbi:hypothetical protein KVR01_004399 [Diaporthe batatas]|uniref:uncharacterized protein n=1 Tax=Diaporthe batatas TaxID=748121 RepID=UPI001D056BC6|nr:uncharacterized protein KVR01_004399 [Diaporthe batatas]KAG8165847.1 hypothetical protein KVR01_004399 [Diaporthe batatas]